MKQVKWICLLMFFGFYVGGLSVYAGESFPKDGGNKPDKKRSASFSHATSVVGITYPGEARLTGHGIRCRGKEGVCLEISAGGNGVVIIIVYLPNGTQEIQACEYTVSETSEETVVTYEPCGN
ncbi:MAG: hypothetical protein SF053_20980 [Bacteroidia bacterium]|nr:hypothetical protein [Bacteroidia bacterium]